MERNDPGGVMNPSSTATTPGPVASRPTGAYHSSQVMTKYYSNSAMRMLPTMLLSCRMGRARLSQPRS